MNLFVVIVAMSSSSLLAQPLKEKRTKSPEHTEPSSAPARITSPVNPPKTDITVAHRAPSQVEKLHANARLILASFNHDQAAMERALKEGADVNARARIKGYTPLILQTGEAQYLPIMRFLLAQPGIDVNARTFDDESADRDFQRSLGNTALHYAVDNSNIEAIKLLLEHGARLDLQNNNDYTPLDLARTKQDAGVINYFNTILPHAPVRTVHIPASVQATIDHIEANTALQNAVKKNDLQTVQNALARGADINTKVADLYGSTPLMNAVQSADIFILKFLLQQPGVALNAINNNKMTALHLAVRSGNRKAVDALIKAKAQLDVQDRFGQTPVHVAVETRQADLVKDLVNANARLDIYNGVGETPLIMAAKMGFAGLIAPLLDHKHSPEELKLFHDIIMQEYPDLMIVPVIRKALKLPEQTAEELQFKFDEDF